MDFCSSEKIIAKVNTQKFFFGSCYSGHVDMEIHSIGIIAVRSGSFLALDTYNTSIVTIYAHDESTVVLKSHNSSKIAIYAHDKSKILLHTCDASKAWVRTRDDSEVSIMAGDVNSEATIEGG